MNYEGLSSEIKVAASCLIWAFGWLAVAVGILIASARKKAKPPYLGGEATQILIFPSIKTKER